MRSKWWVYFHILSFDMCDETHGTSWFDVTVNSFIPPHIHLLGKSTSVPATTRGERSPSLEPGMAPTRARILAILYYFVTWTTVVEGSGKSVAVYRTTRAATALARTLEVRPRVDLQ